MSIWQMNTPEETDTSRKDRVETGIDNVYWSRHYGMYLAKYGSKRLKTKDVDDATHFARYGSKLVEDQGSADEEATGAEIDENPDESKDTEHEHDDRAASHDDDGNDDREGAPDDSEGVVDAKSDDRNKSDAAPKYNILELLMKSGK